MYDHSVHEKLDHILRELACLREKIDHEDRIILMTLDELQTQVRATTDAEDAAIVMIQNIATMLAAAKANPAQVQALADQLKASADKLGRAVVDNTPAAAVGT